MRSISLACAASAALCQEVQVAFHARARGHAVSGPDSAGGRRKRLRKGPLREGQRPRAPSLVRRVTPGAFTHIAGRGGDRVATTKLFTTEPVNREVGSAPGTSKAWECVPPGLSFRLPQALLGHSGRRSFTPANAPWAEVGLVGPRRARLALPGPVNDGEGLLRPHAESSAISARSRSHPEGDSEFPRADASYGVPGHESENRVAPLWPLGLRGWRRRLGKVSPL